MAISYLEFVVKDTDMGLDLLKNYPTCTYIPRLAYSDFGLSAT